MTSSLLAGWWWVNNIGIYATAHRLWQVSYPETYVKTLCGASGFMPLSACEIVPQSQAFPAEGQAFRPCRRCEAIQHRYEAKP